MLLSRVNFIINFFSYCYHHHVHNYFFWMPIDERFLCFVYFQCSARLHLRSSMYDIVNKQLIHVNKLSWLFFWFWFAAIDIKTDFCFEILFFFTAESSSPTTNGFIYKKFWGVVNKWITLLQKSTVHCMNILVFSWEGW